MTRKAAALCACTVVAAGFAVPRQQAPYVPPVAPAIAKTYDTGPTGEELFGIGALTIEPLSGALWVQYGKSTDPPIRIDRHTRAIKTIGRSGSGPDEYRVPSAMVPGVRGDVGIWDSNRRLWFWVDSAGRQVRTWSVPTNSGDARHVFSDLTGRVYIAQPVSFTDYNTQVGVRIDSATGFRDTVNIPFKADPKWRWSSQTVIPGGKRSSTFLVPYAPYVIWGFDRRGRLYAAWSDSNYVQIHDGGHDRRLMMPNIPEPVTSAERDTARAYLDQVENRTKVEGGQFTGPRPPAPTYHPQIEDVLPELNGGIAVVRTRTCANLPDWRAPDSRAPATDPKARCAFVERFDADGRRLRPFTLLKGDQLRAIRGDTAWVVRSNADGLQHVLELVVPKG